MLSREMVVRIKRVVQSDAGPDEIARNILREMRAPSPEMLAAAAALPPGARPAEVWEAMIAAA